MTIDNILAQTIRQNDLLELNTILQESMTAEDSTSENSISHGNLAIYHHAFLRTALSNAVRGNSMYILPEDVAAINNARVFMDNYHGVVVDIAVNESGGGLLSMLTSIFCCICIFGIGQNEMTPSMSGKSGFRGDGFNDDNGDPIA